jgi:hypothetical protein
LSKGPEMADVIFILVTIVSLAVLTFAVRAAQRL